ncbi:MAG: VWA domain-containing protein [Treponemataceae bacterium]|nr:VWA domain-containing protein [Treponemataceae bacterium]
MRMSAYFVCAFMLFSANAAELGIDVSDLRIEEYPDGGYLLFIRQKEGVNSVMLTETTKDPAGVESNYAYRASEYNKINGDELRMLNGEFLVSEYSKNSLMDSTPQADEELGNAFCIYIPTVLVYGYPWSRNGTVEISKGTFINIRTFERAYGDYTGAFLDNPFMFDFVQKPKKDEPEPEPEVILTDAYNPAAAAAFEDIAGAGSGTFIISEGTDSIVDDIMNAFNKINPKDKIDVVFAVDATGSMKDDIQTIRKDFIPRLAESLQECGEVRLGLILYRDYTDSFRYRGLPVKYFDFTDSMETFEKQLNSFSITGREGGDVPEAVYEALYASLCFYEWNPEAQRKVILIGDAEPHPKPRGSTMKCTKELIDSLAKEKDVTVDAIIIPDNKERR